MRRPLAGLDHADALANLHINLKDLYEILKYTAAHFVVDRTGKYGQLIGLVYSWKKLVLHSLTP